MTAMYHISTLNKNSVDSLSVRIKNSDFLVSDDKCTHRFVGMKYDWRNMKEPKITVICTRMEMPVARQIAFVLGKKIYQNSEISALLFRTYSAGQSIYERDYKIIATLYADYHANVKKVYEN